MIDVAGRLRPRLPDETDQEFRRRLRRQLAGGAVASWDDIELEIAGIHFKAIPLIEGRIAGHYPSIFEVQDGDQVEARYSVDGAPVVLATGQAWGGRDNDFRVEDEHGAVLTELTASLKAEFFRRPRTAEWAHELGRRIQSRYL